MGETFNDRIENLRRQSRILLAYIEKNSKTLKKEIKKLQQQNAATTKTVNNCRRCYNAQVARNFNSWKRRNDSSGVNAALRPEYIYNCPTSASTSVPNMACKKLLITSKKYSEDLHTKPCNKTQGRKPIRACYCSSEVNKIKHWSPRTHQKLPYQCEQCKSCFNSVSDRVHECTEQRAQSPSISSETLRRIQRIDYIPRSQFLRNVQSKISVLHPTTLGNCYPKSPQPSTLNAEQSGEDIYQNQSKIISNNYSKSTNQLSTSNSSLSVPANSEISDKDTYIRKNPTTKLSKGVQVDPENLKPKFTRKKTKTTKEKAVQSLNEEPSSESSTKEKNFHRHDDMNAHCHCACRQKTKRLSKKVNSNNVKENDVCSKRCPRCCWQGTRINEEANELENRFEESDQDVRDLRKFRDQNYFDTHGSSQTLLCCRSTDSLQQFCMNETLFPETMRKISRRNVATTTSPWPTVQRKRVHYFPKHIVPQEKTLHNKNYKKRRFQTCPLTGHAIDRGVVKVSPPLDSLALTHQKRML